MIAKFGIILYTKRIRVKTIRDLCANSSLHMVWTTVCNCAMCVMWSLWIHNPCCSVHDIEPEATICCCRSIWQISLFCSILNNFATSMGGTPTEGLSDSYHYVDTNTGAGNPSLIMSSLATYSICTDGSYCSDLTFQDNVAGGSVLAGFLIQVGNNTQTYLTIDKSLRSC